MECHVYMRNNTGPKTEPWGTPLGTTTQSEKDFSIFTRCFLFAR